MDKKISFPQFMYDWAKKTGDLPETDQEGYLQQTVDRAMHNLGHLEKPPVLVHLSLSEDGLVIHGWTARTYDEWYELVGKWAQEAADKRLAQAMDDLVNRLLGNRPL